MVTCHWWSWLWTVSSRIPLPQRTLFVFLVCRSRVLCSNYLDSSRKISFTEFRREHSEQTQWTLLGESVRPAYRAVVSFSFFVFNSGSDTITDFTIYIIYGVFTSVTVVGIIILSVLRMPTLQDDNTETAPSLPASSTVPELSQVELLKSTIRLCLSKRMLLLIVAFMYTGIELSFWSGIYPASIGFTKQLGSNTKSLVGLNAITQGLGQASGGFLFGILSSKTAAIGRDRIVMLGALINILAFVGVYVNFPNDAPLHETQGTGLIEPQIAIALVCGYLLGFGDACWNTQIYSQLITNYNKQSAQAFSLFKFFQSLLTCAAFWYGSVFDLHIQLIMLTAGAILGCFCFVLAERLPIDSSENETSDVHVD
ncbi:hypothetical protein M3Y94_00818800 [Aphelenchoides besseyi]|nr:hypothetical protein M3Y94_00818800 [Aphelenchoides besseyi]